MHGSVTCEATPFGLVDETKGSCTGTRRTKPTCVAPPQLGMFLDALMHVVVALLTIFFCGLFFVGVRALCFLFNLFFLRTVEYRTVEYSKVQYSTV